MQTEQQLVRLADLNGGQFMPAKSESTAKFCARVFETEQMHDSDGCGGEIASLMNAAERGTVLPPVIVSDIQGELYLADGWHRVHAAALRGRAAVRAIVFKVASFAQADLVSETVFDLSTSGTPWQDQVEAVERLLAA